MFVLWQSLLLVGKLVSLSLPKTRTLSLECKISSLKLQNLEAIRCVGLDHFRLPKIVVLWVTLLSFCPVSLLVQSLAQQANFLCLTSMLSGFRSLCIAPKFMKGMIDKHQKILVHIK